ncbi:enhanced serine sensitivity protein SseB C-terminal domain-containing protein [Hymenobacter ruricola]|uniref:Enhanced serine sensitivity protein SseB C-terminal domain-containing protein n=1 Tax=Hymenobacter ruricola TaxID=2791023 RepID=A0ABS0I125_9BACT|nr:enhanced serine sensitivity protein SseB C-terminal domain-containing protein [Hymenobacter ruricola]MBF9220597.1 enhanced serine sensitivity protein SseB C-terminal domain-containing protein [Hymenobacter ruricola]
MDSQDIFDESKLVPGPNEFDPAADLDDLMAQAGQNPAYRPEFLRRLLLSPLLVLVEDEPARDETQADYVGFTPLQLSDGYVPLFTSLARLHDNPALVDYQHISVKGRDLLAALQQRDLCLNPFSEASINLPAAICQRLLAGDDFGAFKQSPPTEQREVLIGQPAEYPTAPVEAIRLLLSSHPRVQAGYLTYLLASGEEPAHFIIGLQLEGEFKGIAQEVAYVASTFQKELGNQYIVQQVIPDTDEFSAYVLSTEPFYARE